MSNSTMKFILYHSACQLRMAQMRVSTGALETAISKYRRQYRYYKKLHLAISLVQYIIRDNHCWSMLINLARNSMINTRPDDVKYRRSLIWPPAWVKYESIIYESVVWNMSSPYDFHFTEAIRDAWCFVKGHWWATIELYFDEYSESFQPGRL